jgi:uncharacterized protein (DUF2345 family)
MSLSLEQSLEEGRGGGSGVKVTEDRDDLDVTILPSSFKITETINPQDRSYELRHFKASFIRWQHNGSILIAAHSVNLDPNEGYLDILSTGYTHITSEHNIKLVAKGHKITGGGNKAEDKNKSVEIAGAGDIHIQSDGKGGIYVTAAQNIEFKAGGSIILNAAEQVSINTGAKGDEPVGDSEASGSGKFVVSTGKYELATATYKENVSGLKHVVNTGELTQEQKTNTNEPALPNQHITHTETVGSLVHKIDHDYVLEVGGKMLLKVLNSPSKTGGALQGGGSYGSQTEALVQEITGTRKTSIKKSASGNSDDETQIVEGYSVTEVLKGRNNLSFRVDSVSTGDIVLESKAKGIVALQSNTDPIYLSSQAGDVRIEALAKMVEITGTTEVRVKGARINLN